MLAQLKITQPPVLAVISPDGKVYQEYTGWISREGHVAGRRQRPRQ